MSGNLNVSTINGVDVSVSGVATQAFANSLLYEAEVTGSARTSIDFPLLDINTHKSYRIEIELVCMASCVIYGFVNGDTTITNYYTQASGASAAVFSGGRYNYPAVVQPNVVGSHIANFLIEKVNGVPNMVGVHSFQLGTTPVFYNFFAYKTATVTNITQLTFTSSVASAIGIGSKIRIYRGDV